jgi:hypothetical protein
MRMETSGNWYFYTRPSAAGAGRNTNMILGSNGTTTLNGALSGTSATFASSVTATSIIGQKGVFNNSDASGYPLVVHSGTGANGLKIIGRSDNLGYIEFFNYDGTTVNSSINGSTGGLQFTGASTFSSSVTATSYFSSTGYVSLRSGVDNKSTGVPWYGLGYIGGSAVTNLSGYFGVNINTQSGTSSFNQDGTATFSSSVTATAFFATSDIRLKTIVHKNNTSSDIRAISYTWKDKSKGKTVQVGYSAQEVQRHMPDAVNIDKEGILSVNYIQVLVAKVASLEKQLKQLQDGI